MSYLRMRASALVAATLTAALGACTEPPPPPRTVAATWGLGAEPTASFSEIGDWPSYHRDLAGTRFSPLDEISPDNVARLELAWQMPLGRHVTAGTEFGGLQVTPLVVANVLYTTTADTVIAVRASDGELLWRHELDRGLPSRRGLAYWPGVNELQPRIYFTSGRRLIALDAATGTRARGFGVDGEIDMGVAYNGAPTLFEHLLIVGSNSAPGSVRAFDVRNGAPLWVFHAVPRPWEEGYDTWATDAGREQDQVLHWAFSLTVDVDRGLLYAVFESPGPEDHYGGNRPGDTLFGNSIVALDARTGERRWHFQTVRHDLWNFDLPAPPVLLDVRRGNAVVPALAQPTKQGYLFVLNRVTGAPLLPVEDRPVPPSDVPGEQAARTQPVPSRPPPLARVSFAAEELVTARQTTSEHAARCRELVERAGAHNAGPFTPLRYRAADVAPRATLIFPGDFGGASWAGAAAHPGRGLVFVNTTNLGSLGWIEEVPPMEGASAAAVPMRAMSHDGEGVGRFWADGSADGPRDGTVSGALAWPCQRPPWGELSAVDVATGEVLWRVPLGITEELPESRQRTGRPNVGGAIVTAGGLLFIGATNDQRFRAFDVATGEELWSTVLPRSAHAVPITYADERGKQYVAIVAGGANVLDDVDPEGDAMLMVYALPR